MHHPRTWTGAQARLRCSPRRCRGRRSPCRAVPPSPRSVSPARMRTWLWRRHPPRRPQLTSRRSCSARCRLCRGCCRVGLGRRLTRRRRVCVSGFVPVGMWVWLMWPRLWRGVLCLSIGWWCWVRVVGSWLRLWPGWMARRLFVVLRVRVVRRFCSRVRVLSGWGWAVSSTAPLRCFGVRLTRSVACWMRGWAGRCVRLCSRARGSVCLTGRCSRRRLCSRWRSRCFGLCGRWGLCLIF